MSATIDKIRSCADLPPRGLDYGSERTIMPHTIALAVAAEKMLRAHGYPETDAFPAGDGVITVTGYLNRVCVEITISEESY